MTNPVVIGNATLYLGDCREILPTLPKVDAVVTDPPYGIGWSKPFLENGNSRAHAGIQGDMDCSVRDFALSSKVSDKAIVFGSFMAPFPANVRQVLVWHKPADSGLFGAVAGYRRDIEAIFLVGEWPATTGLRSSVLTGMAQFRGHAAASSGSHPHTKPVDLMEKLLAVSGAQCVVDPFMGSGSTGVACMNLGRKFIGIEIEPSYFDIACERIKAAQDQLRLFA